MLLQIIVNLLDPLWIDVFSKHTFELSEIHWFCTEEPTDFLRLVYYSHIAEFQRRTMNFINS